MNEELKSLQQKDKDHHLHPFTDHLQLSEKGTRVITRGDGVYIWDSEGHQILDAMSGLWCVNLGYGRKELAQAAYEQMEELPYYNNFFQCTHPPAIELSSVLGEVSPKSMDHVFFTSSGSEAIDTAEDRELFKELVNELNLLQPYNEVATNLGEALKNAKKVKYPLVVRPSYVLGGRAMEIVYNDNELETYMSEAVKVSNESPVLLDHFLNKAIEVDVDAVSDGKQVIIGGIMEHIEQAGVHSGDSSCSIPAYSLSDEIQEEIIRQMIQFTKQLNVVGLVNAQFAIRKEKIFILEVNPRASRTVPFVSKATGNQLAKIAAKVMIGIPLSEQNIKSSYKPNFFSVKGPVFPFNKFPDTDPILGPEMKSTGEVMGTGESFGEAYIKSQYGAGISIPDKGNVFISVREPDKSDKLIKIANFLTNNNFEIVATKGTADYLRENNINCSYINKVHEGQPHIVDLIKDKKINLVINTTEGKQSIEESFSIRAEAVISGITYYTSLEAALATIESFDFLGTINVNKLQNYLETDG